MPVFDPHPPLSRRGLLATAGLAPALLGTPLPLRAETRAELSVTEALRNRRSTRAFAARPIDPGLLAELLWAAFGVNRPGTDLHTAPSWHGVADVRVHVATAEGVLAYDPATDATAQVTPEDIRSALSPQPFVASAPACLIFVSDLTRLEAAPTEDERRFWATVNAAIAAENVYLFAAARGLGTCLVGGLDRAAVSARLALPPELYPTFLQPVGWPA